MNITLICVSGLVQKFTSIDNMMKVYNDKINLYDLRKDDKGNEILFHKSHKTIVGHIKHEN